MKLGWIPGEAKTRKAFWESKTYEKMSYHLRGCKVT